MLRWLFLTLGLGAGNYTILPTAAA
jgi:hypothetical protein